MSFTQTDVEAVIKRRLEPLFDLDGGAVCVVCVDPARGEVLVSFAGSYRACPGRSVLLERVLQPTLQDELAGVVSVGIG